jgi:hypothetical protein
LKEVNWPSTGSESRVRALLTYNQSDAYLISGTAPIFTNNADCELRFRMKALMYFQADSWTSRKTKLQL